MRDKYAENIYWPLINAVLVTVYTSIAKKKLDTYSDNEISLRKKISDLEGEKSECKGKISVLNEVKQKITLTVSKNESFFQKVVKEVKHVTGIENKKPEEQQVIEIEKSSYDPEFENKKQRIIDDSYIVIEQMKKIEDEHENNFQEYLKSLAKVMVNNKVLKD